MLREVKPPAKNLNALSVANAIHANAGRPWELVFDVTVWIIRSGTVLEQGQPRADKVEAALRLVSAIASPDTSRGNVLSCKKDKERAVGM